ncbi:MAG: GNAT family N-acetyltransferase [Thermotogota bacterium]
MHIITNNLIIKPHTKDNKELLYKWMNDANLAYYDDEDPEPYEGPSWEKMEKIMERFIKSTPEKNGDIIHLAIHKKDSNDFIGFTMIALIDKYHKKCHLGLTIGNKEEWGKGYGTEVVKAMIKFAFNDLKMNRVGAEIYSHNIGSIKIFEKSGFKKEGIIRQSVLKNSHYKDEFIYGILKEEYWR